MQQSQRAVCPRGERTNGDDLIQSRPLALPGNNLNDDNHDDGGDYYDSDNDNDGGDDNNDSDDGDDDHDQDNVEYSHLYICSIWRGW